MALVSLSQTLYFTNLLPDEFIYHTWTAQMASGTYRPTAVYQLAPLPAYVTAALYKLFAPDPLYVRMLNIVLGSATCVVVYLLGQAMANQATGLIAGLIAALYKPFIFYSIVPLKTALSVFLFAISIYLFVTVIREPSRMYALFLGLAIGLTLSVRENTILMIPFMVILMLWSGRQDAFTHQRFRACFLMFALGVMLATAPIAIRNYIVAGELLLTTPQAGLSLYIGNNLANPDPYYRPVSFAAGSAYEQPIQFRIEASRRGGRTLSPREASSYWILEVWRMAVRQPAAFLWKLWQKTLVLLNQFEAGDHYSIDFLSQFATFFKFPFLGIALILPLGLGGMAISASKSRPLLCVSVLFLVYAATLVVFFTNMRYRLPLLVLLIPFAVIGIGNLCSSIGKRQFKTLGTYVGVVVLFVVVEYLPVQATDDITAYYNVYALMLDRDGSEKKAMTYWETSSSMNKPFSAFANLALARKYLVKKDVQRAELYLDRIQDRSFAAASKYEVLGDSFVVQGQVRDAIAAYERSLAINSGNLEPRRKLGRLFSKIDRERTFQEYRTLKEISSFYTGF